MAMSLPMRLCPEERKYLQYQLTWQRTRPCPQIGQWGNMHIFHVLRALRKITATSWGGVVTAFITVSNIKGEIDWEFPGASTTNGQTIFLAGKHP
ncbi:hypothetical protein BJV74DRAFT_416053 [Russula compacta]|nr:hypothetical protein BJV74DRAFT_416053 [Russula compacta]